MVFSHPQSAVATVAATATTASGPAATTGSATARTEPAYSSLFLEPDLPVGIDDADTDYDEPEFVEPTREVTRPRRNQHGRGDARRSNRRRPAA